MSDRLSPQRETEIREQLGQDVVSRIWRAIAAPGSFTPRHSDAETESDWQARAVLMVIGENHFAKRDLLAELAAVRAERDEACAQLAALGRPQLPRLTPEEQAARETDPARRTAWRMLGNLPHQRPTP